MSGKGSSPSKSTSSSNSTKYSAKSDSGTKNQDGRDKGDKKSPFSGGDWDPSDFNLNIPQNSTSNWN